MLVPPHWWLRLLAYKSLVAKPPLGHLASFGLFFDNPRGGIEDVAMFAHEGVKWGAINVGPEHPDETWSVWAHAATVHGFDFFPWRRCFTRDDLLFLVISARRFGKKTIGLNYELGFHPPTTLTASEIMDVLSDNPDLEVILVTSPWLEDGVDWPRLAKRCSFLLEGFTNEGHHVPELVEHARAVGAATLSVMAGVYPARFSSPTGLAEWRRLAGDLPAPIIYLGEHVNTTELLRPWRP